MSDSDISEIAVVDHGQGHPLMLVHGFPLDHSMWKHQISDLSNDYRVLAVDLPGFGKSEPLESPISIRDYADALAAMLDNLQIDQPVTFCGLSMGGYIGWQFLKHHREKIHSLIACDTRAANDDDRTARGRRLMAQQVVKDGSQSVAAGMTLKICGETTQERNPDVIQHVAAMIRATDPQSIAAGQLAMSKREDATSMLETIDVPTLFAVGMEDTITPPDEMKSLADSVSNSRYAEIPHAGHLAPLENPVAFNAAIRSFLESAV
ncbi:alpha/beta hydrolase [Mariniblastus sp.]|nr:alpha/beta hydrolase [Mariniblastus sp.]